MKNINDKKIAFVGSGKMGEAIIAGFIYSGKIPAENVYASARSRARMEELAARYPGLHGVDCSGSEGLKMLAEAADIIIIAVLPSQAKGVFRELKPLLRAEKHMVISVMGDVSTESIGEYLGDIPAVRAMPNTPMGVGAGCTALCPAKSAEREHMELASELFGCAGLAIELKEELMNAFTAVAGCGPAFSALFIGALADAGVKHGLARSAAIRIAAQTLAGTGRMVVETGVHPEKIKDDVCSPGGSTIAGVATLDRRGFRGIASEAVDAAVSRMEKD